MGCGIDIYFWRQIFVLIAAGLTAFSTGMMISFPAVLNPSILSTNSTIHATSDQASWIAASNGISGILGFCIISPLFQIFGRKYVNFGINVIFVIGWIIIIFSNSIYDLLSARIIQGINIGSYFITIITVSEYCDPKRRGYFLSIKKISSGCGSLVCHSLAFAMGWRQIAIFGAGSMVISSIMILFWSESPAFLAMKYRFDDCKSSFTWIHGNSVEKQKELKELIRAQTERKEMEKEASMKFFAATKLFKTLLRKDFLKPFFIVSMLTLAIDACGRYVLLAYLTQIIVEITGDEVIAMYCSVVSDLLLISALSISCLLIKLFNRRTLLFSLGTFAIILMFLVTLMLILKTHFDIAINLRWLVPSIILIHSFVAYVGLVPTAFAITAEIFPLEHKGLGSFTSGIVFTSFYALSMKMTPIMIESTGVSGTYAIYGLCLSLCLLLLYPVLPETKDKTLQEIEDEIKGRQKSFESELLLNDSGRNKNIK